MALGDRRRVAVGSLGIFGSVLGTTQSSVELQAPVLVKLRVNYSGNGSPILAVHPPLKGFKLVVSTIECCVLTDMKRTVLSTLDLLTHVN